MLKKLLWKNNSKMQLIGAFGGSLVGFILLLGSLQIFFDINSIFNTHENLINPDYIVINKKVSVLNTITQNRNSFSDKDIADLKSQNFIEAVAPFVSNQFRLSANTGRGGNIPYFRTELFFEAIPDNYLDTKIAEWHWNDSSDVIPVILPKDYINLYNFGFAESQGLPQVSNDMLSIFRFNIVIKGKGKIGRMKGKIVGFSDRVNSVLVPQVFLDWANITYGDDIKFQPSRLIIIAKDPSSPELQKYLERNNYETNSEKLRNSKLNAILRIILGIVAIVAFIIIGLAFMIFILGFQLIITRSENKLRILLNLGFKYLKLSKLYIQYFLIIVILINIVSVLTLFILKHYLFNFMTNSGFGIDSGVNWIVFLIGFLLSTLLVGINSLFIIRQIKKLA